MTMSLKFDYQFAHLELRISKIVTHNCLLAMLDSTF
jgi:hypothetical protein